MVFVFSALGPDNPGSWSWLARALKNYRTPLLGAFSLMLFASMTSLLFPWLAGGLADVLVSSTKENSLSLAAALIAVTIARSVANYFATLLSVSAGESMLLDLRGESHQRILQMKMSSYHAHHRGEYINLISEDIPTAAGFLTSTALGLLPQILILIGTLVAIYLISPLALYFVAIGIPIYLLILRFLTRSINPLSAALFDKFAASMDLMIENFDLLKQIKSAQTEDAESRSYRSLNNDIYKNHLSLLKSQLAIGPVTQILGISGITILLWATSLEDNELVAGDLVSLLLYGLLFTQTAGGLARVYGEYQNAAAALDRVRRMLNLPGEPYGVGQPMASITGPALEFKNVSFTYPDGRLVLNNFSLNIAAGEKVVITGHNGAGKSTLIDLICRFHKPTDGEILLNGQDIQALRLEDVRQQVSLIPQSALLFNRTIQENLVYGSDVEPPLFKFLDFVYDADRLGESAGEHGSNLSGGERQRVLLAQLLSRKASLVILDEATSMLDARGEEAFWLECQPYLEGKTLIIVSQNPEVVSIAERTIRLEPIA